MVRHPLSGITPPISSGAIPGGTPQTPWRMKYPSKTPSPISLTPISPISPNHNPCPSKNLRKLQNTRLLQRSQFDLKYVWDEHVRHLFAVGIPVCAVFLRATLHIAQIAMRDHPREKRRVQIRSKPPCTSQSSVDCF